MEDVSQTRSVALSVQRIFMLANELEREVGRDLGVSPTDYRALSVLMQAGPLTVGELAAAIGASYATTTALANRLESAGHLRRARIDADHRKVHLSVEEGTAARVIDLMRDPMHAAMSYVDSLSDGDRGAVAAFTSALVRMLEDHLAKLSTAPAPGTHQTSDEPTRKDR